VSNGEPLSGQNEPLPAPAVFVLSLVVAEPLAFFMAFFLVAINDAGGSVGDRIIWSELIGAFVLVALASWLSIEMGWALLTAVGLSVIGAMCVHLAVALGWDLTSYLFRTIGWNSAVSGIELAPAALDMLAFLVLVGWKTAKSVRITRTKKCLTVSLALLALLALGTVVGEILAVRFSVYRERRLQASEVAARLAEYGLVSEWHPVYGFQVKGSNAGQGIDPALLDRIVPILTNARQVKLSFDNSALTDDQMPLLSGIQHLEELNLTDTSITDGGLKHLQRCQELGSLWLGGCRITNVGIAYLSEMPSVTGIFLATSQERPNNVRVTDEGILRLRNLENLHVLQLPRNVSDGTMRELRRAIPGLAVYYGY
jgi:hypothetical protein